MNRINDPNNTNRFFDKLVKDTQAWAKKASPAEIKAFMNGDHPNAGPPGIGFDSPEVKADWIRKMRGSVAESSGNLLERAAKNLTGGSVTSRVIRGAGVGLGAVYTYDGIAKLFTPRKQEITPEGEMVETPAPSKMGALLQAAAGAGVIAASLFLKGKGPAI